MKAWWSSLSNTERALLIGGGFTAVSALLMGAVVSKGLEKGIPIRIDMGPNTKSLVAKEIHQTNLTLKKLSTRGIPVYVLVGAKTLTERREDERPKRA